MSTFFFFSDPTKLTAQSASLAYGPDTAVPSEKYRVTSVHAGTNAYAYAVSDGDIILIDKVVDAAGANRPDLINIVLKPIDQPETGLPFVLFYLYKGIRKDSLVDTTNTPNTIKPYSASGAAGNLDLLKVGSSRVDLQACKLEYSIVSPK